MNKPVAWINIEDGNSILDWEKDEYAQKHYPLYTHPVDAINISQEYVDKTQNNRHELTDEEIDAIGDEVSSLIDTYAGRREFARAILRKAQKK